ncbi:MAG: FHA domain-containing protein [Planctomycetia bacterium]|nr:FHA domain-containing protein [Planctomycetia bacterium]
MDDIRPYEDTSRLSAPRPYRPHDTDLARPGELVPLQLVLVPTGMNLELTKPDQVLGRHSTADIRLPLADISRKHCRFIFADGCWQIIDLDSLNGVFVNNQRVHRAILRQGDRIRLGGFTFEVRLPEIATILEPRGGLRRAS